MTAYFYTFPQLNSAILFGHLGRAISSSISAVADWNDARITRNALAGLTDHELDDIGLSRDGSRYVCIR